MSYIIFVENIPVEVDFLPESKMDLSFNFEKKCIKLIAPPGKSPAYITFYLTRPERLREIINFAGRFNPPCPAENILHETVYVLGKPYKLELIEHKGKNKIEIENDRFKMYVHPGSSTKTRLNYLNKWYRNILKETAEGIIKKWEPVIEVKVDNLLVKKLLACWGKAYTNIKSITLNTTLAKHSRECIEAIVVHEMIHLIQKHPDHDKGFYKLMDKYLSGWKTILSKLDNEPF